MLEDVVLHDMIVTMGIYAKRMCPFKSPFEHAIPYSMHIRPTCQTVDDIVWFIVQPCTFIDLCVCWFGSRQEGEVCHNPSVICDHIATMSIYVRMDSLLGGIAVDPLVHVPRSVHHLPCCIYHRHDSRNIGHYGFAYSSHGHLCALTNSIASLPLRWSISMYRTATRVWLMPPGIATDLPISCCKPAWSPGLYFSPKRRRP